MIKLAKPNDSNIIEILKGFLEGKYSYEDLAQWQAKLYEHYCDKHPGCISFQTESKTAHFLLYSLSFINDSRDVYFRQKCEHFIRRADIQDYLLELQNFDCEDSNGPIKRVYQHQIKQVDFLCFPLVSISCTDKILIDKFRVFFRRGIIDDLAERTEFCTIEFERVNFFVDYSHDRAEYQFTIHGFCEYQPQLINLLIYLDIKFGEIDWINKEKLHNETELWRLDDNDNQFLMETFDTYLEAELMRFDYEARGHKQLYFTK